MFLVMEYNRDNLIDNEYFKNTFINIILQKVAVKWVIHMIPFKGRECYQQTLTEEGLFSWVSNWKCTDYVHTWAQFHGSAYRRNSVLTITIFCLRNLATLGSAPYHQLALSTSLTPGRETQNRVFDWPSNKPAIFETLCVSKKSIRRNACV